jgi:predicted metal-dependent peptidase
MTAAWEPCEVTPAQIKAWADTRAALIWHCPAFTHILYTMMNKVGGEHIALFTKDVPIAATDGSHVLINPDTFFPLSLSERIFVVAHEVSHGIFGHVEMMHKLKMAGKVCYPDGKELGFDAQTMNMAMDYVINDMLIESKIGSYKDTWLHDPVIATHKDSVMTAYRRLYKDNGGNPSGQPGTGMSQSSQGKGQGPFDKHLDPGTTTGQDATQAANGRSDVEWKTAIAGAIASAKAQGKLPAAMERMMSDSIEPKVDWTEKVIGFFSRKPGGGTYDWRRPDRRFITRNIVAPARSGFGSGPVVVAIDTSGSIGQKELDVFFGEMFGILDDVRPSALFVMWCDAKVHRTDEIHDTGDLLDLRMKRAPGGGGTAFEPVFDEIQNLGIEPDALIYLTDGMGSFPKTAPTYSVLWGNIYPASKYPWGEVIDIPIK